MSLTPDDLLDIVGAALRPPPVEPSPKELAAFHRMIDERCGAPVIRRAPARRVWARPLAVAAAAAGLVVGSGAAAFAVGAPVPRPIRAVVYDVGLPVDSPQLADAKGTASELRIVLAVNDTATIKRVRARLNRELAEVPRDERGEIEKDAKALLARADQQLRTADDATSPATGSATPKSGKGATELVGSMSGSGSTKAPSGSTGTGGALTGGSAADVSGSGPGAASPPSLPLPRQPSGSTGSPLPALPSVPPVVSPPAAVAPAAVAPVREKSAGHRKTARSDANY